MVFKSTNPYYHIFYWFFVIAILTMVFGMSWGNNVAAFFFITMLLPVVLGTSYFFNYVLVPRYLMKKKYFWFGLYSFYTVVVSLYLEMFVLMFAYMYLGHFSFRILDPNASDIILLAVVMYLLVFIGSFLLMIRQIKENQQTITQLLIEKEKMKKSFLEITSNRKITKIPYDEIIYIESLSDYIKVNTINDQIISKERISNLANRLPDIFLRIHRSFIINKERIKNFSYDEILVDNIQLPIGRSYSKAVKEALKKD